MPDDRDHFGDGALGTGYGKYTPSYRHGEAMADTIKGVFAPLNSPPPTTRQPNRASGRPLGNAASNSFVEDWWEAAEKIIEYQPLRAIDGLGRGIMHISLKINGIIAGLAVLGFWMFVLSRATGEMTGQDIGGMCLLSALGGGLVLTLHKIIGGTIVGIAGAMAMVLIAVWQLLKIALWTSAALAILWLVIKGVQFGIHFFGT
jgi:hypothetical protein